MQQARPVWGSVIEAQENKLGSDTGIRTRILALREFRIPSNILDYAHFCTELTIFLYRGILVARTGIEPVVSALRGRRVKPITLPGHTAKYTMLRGSYSMGVTSALRSSRNMGSTEKNLFRQGSQRNAGTRKTRPRMDAIPGTCSAEIRCNSRLPQIPQCAWNKFRNGTVRA